MSDEQRHPNVIHVEESEEMARDKGRFSFKARLLGEPTGGAGIGCCWYEVQPGKTAFPFHYHSANEESIFVLEGQGTLRLGDETIELRAGHYVTMPVGPDHPHQLVATGDAPLRYLCMSTQIPTEVVGYPDSNKIAAISGAPGAAWGDRWVAKWFPGDADVDYFDGEDTGE